jgi:hypothetical protein
VDASLLRVAHMARMVHLMRHASHLTLSRLLVPVTRLGQLSRCIGWAVGAGKGGCRVDDGPGVTAVAGLPIGWGSWLRMVQPVEGTPFARYRPIEVLAGQR